MKLTKTMVIKKWLEHGGGGESISSKEMMEFIKLCSNDEKVAYAEVAAKEMSVVLGEAIEIQ